MLHISDGLLLNYIEANEKFNLKEIIDKKRFKVADSPLTYRQTNALSNDKLLPDDRDNKEGWHKYSLKELIYILIVADLKKFGVKHEQLGQLWESFFKEPTKKEKEVIVEINKSVADMAIGITFSGVEMIVTLNADGYADFFAPAHYLLFNHRETPQITLKLSDYLNQVLQKIGKDPINIKFDMENIAFDNGMTEKEADLMEIIRNRDYSTVRIRKKDGEIVLVTAEKVKNESQVTTQDLIQMINLNDFQNINIIKRDGKIVNYKVEETIKV